MVRFIVKYLIAFGVSLIVLVLPSHARTSLAIIYSDDSLSNLADLLSVEFTRDKELTLIERDQIDAILKEHELRLSGILPDDRIFAIGYLLGVDVILFLDGLRSESEKWLSVRLTSVRHAVILEELLFLFPTGRLDSLCTDLIENLSPSLKKAELPLEQSVAISILGLRNILADDTIMLEEYINPLLRHRLNKIHHIYVVERERMNDILLEKILSKQSTKEFLSGAILVDGSIEEKFQTGKVKIELRLRTPQTTKDYTIEGTRNDIDSLVAQLTQAISTSAGISDKEIVWDKEAEAREFIKKAECYLRANQYEKALEVTNTAWALGARDEKSIKIRADSLSANVFPTLDCYGPVYGGTEPLAPERDTLMLELHQINYVLELLDLAEGYMNRYSHCFHESYLYLITNISRFLYMSTLPHQEVKFDPDKVSDIRRRLRNYYHTVQESSIVKRVREGLFVNAVPVYAAYWCDTPQETISFLSEIYQSCKYINDPDAAETIRLRLYWMSLLQFARSKEGNLGFILRPNGKTKIPFPYQTNREKERLTEIWSDFLNDLIKQNDPMLSFVVYTALASLFSEKQMEHYEAALTNASEYLKEHKEAIQEGKRTWTLNQLLSMIERCLLILYDHERHPVLTEQRMIWRFVYDIHLFFLENQLDARELRFISLNRFYWYGHDTKVSCQIWDLLTEQEIQELFHAAQGTALIQNYTRNLIEELKRKFPYLEMEKSKNIIAFERLPITFENPNPRRGFFIRDIIYQDQKIWFLGDWDANIIWSFDIKNGEVETISIPDSLFPPIENGVVLNLLVVGSKYLLVTRTNGGFATYCFTTGKWQHLMQPDKNIHSVAYLNGKFYLGFGGPYKTRSVISGLAEFNPEDGTYSILCSTRRTPAQTPLDDTDHYWIRHIIPYDSSHLLLSVLSEANRKIMGTWKVDIKTREFMPLRESTFSVAPAPEGCFIYWEPGVYCVEAPGKLAYAKSRNWSNLGAYIRYSDEKPETPMLIDEKANASGQWRIGGEAFGERTYDGQNVWFVADEGHTLYACNPTVKAVMKFTVQHKNADMNKSSRVKAFLWTPSGLVVVDANNNVWYADHKVLKEAMHNYTVPAKGIVER